MQYLELFRMAMEDSSYYIQTIEAFGVTTSSSDYC